MFLRQFAKLCSRKALGASKSKIVRRSYQETVTLDSKSPKYGDLFSLCFVLSTAVCLLNSSSECVSEDEILKPPTTSASFPTQLALLEKELHAFLNDDQIETDVEERKQRGKPWNSYHRISTYPDMIITPSSTEEVSRVVALCFKYKIPIIPFGGGTSIEGQTLALIGGISLDLSGMKAVLSLNEQDLDATVQAGLGYIELNDILKEKGLWFPLDPGPGASIGG
jgi:hypothetical protein